MSWREHGNLRPFFHVGLALVILRDAVLFTYLGWSCRFVVAAAVVEPAVDAAGYDV